MRVSSLRDASRMLANALKKRYFARKLAKYNTRLESNFLTERIVKYVARLDEH